MRNLVVFSVMLACMLFVDCIQAQCRVVNGRLVCPVLGAPVRAVKAVINPLDFNVAVQEPVVVQASTAIVEAGPPVEAQKSSASDMASVVSHPEFYDVVTSVVASSPAVVHETVVMESHGAAQVRHGVVGGVAKHAVGVTKGMVKKSVCAVVKATGRCRRK